jgi:putative transposase
MLAATELSSSVGTGLACEAFGMPKATYHRRLKPKPVDVNPSKRRRSPRRLTAEERVAVLVALHSNRFVDCSPSQVYATLLDDGVYLCSISTMYRILRAELEVRERRAQRQRPNYTKPELLATGPNQVWSWDITRLLGPVKWSYFQLYVILDIFSRYVVGWLVAPRESEALAVMLLEQTCAKQQIGPGELIVHADRGSSMTSKSVAFLLADLGVEKTHSRPQVSNDNPYSESQFKTMKYRPEFPDRFDSIEHARSFSRQFFDWYNTVHRHSGIGLLTPAAVHYGRADEITARRANVLAVAYAATPERFVRGLPQPPAQPLAVWINPPDDEAAALQRIAALRPGSLPLSIAESLAFLDPTLSAQVVLSN